MSLKHQPSKRRDGLNTDGRNNALRPQGYLDRSTSAAPARLAVASGLSQPLPFLTFAAHSTIRPRSPAPLDQPRRRPSTDTRVMHPPLEPALDPSSELNLQNGIAEVEIREHTSRRDAASFYRAPRRLPTRLHRNNEAYDHSAPGDDTRLMLFRDPPPWDALESWLQKLSMAKLTRVGTPRAPDDLAILDRGSTKAKTGLEGVMEIVQRRMKFATQDIEVTNQPAQAVEGPNPRYSSISRNPFVKKRPAREPLTDSTATSSQTSVIGDLAKPLKPISSLSGTYLLREAT
jgi:hypothetical protein